MKTTPTAVSSKMQLFERKARAHVAKLRATLAGPLANIRELFMRIFVGPLRFSANGERERVAIAPSDRARLYLFGVRGEDEACTGAFFVSYDGARTWVELAR